jgi:HlyD family secretion protein
MKKKALWITGVLVALLVAGFLTYRAIASNKTSEVSQQTATVQLGSISSALSSSGTARSGQSATINWKTSGKVDTVSLKAGDLVEADQVLASLDTNTLTSEMITAKQNLIDAKQNLDDLLNSKITQAKALQAVENAQKALDSLKVDSATQSSAAQLALANAQEALTTAQKNRTKMNYPHATDKLVIEKAETDYLLAKKVYKDALSAYNQVAKLNLTKPERVKALNDLVNAKQVMDSKFATYNWYILNYSTADITQADAELAVAQANLEKAQADYDELKNGATTAAITLAEANLADAQREYERVKDGPTQDDIAAAQFAVDAAQATLDNAILLAPFAGTVTEVNVSTGDLVNAGDSAFRIDDLSSIYIDLSVSEVDLPDLKVGQQAVVEFDAIPDKQYTGEVTEIGIVGTNSQGVVNYPVTIKITDSDASIKPGMTASVSITTAQDDNVLLVPKTAIKTTGGQRMVTVLFNGQQISVPVTLVMTSDGMSEIQSDQLREGDTILISGTSSSTSTSTSTSNRTDTGGFGPQGITGGIPAGGPPAGMP